MSLTDEQQMSCDTEAAAAHRMDGPPRSSHKLLMLQVWTGLLTLSLVVMATVLISTKSKPAESGVFAPMTKGNFSQLAGADFPSFSFGESSSYIELVKSLDGGSWHDDLTCESCSLILKENSIYCNRTSSAPYVVYAQVTFQSGGQARSVTLIRNATASGKLERTLVEVPAPAGGSVCVMKIIRLKQGESIRLEIAGETQNENTFWGAFQLH